MKLGTKNQNREVMVFETLYKLARSFHSFACVVKSRISTHCDIVVLVDILYSWNSVTSKLSIDFFSSFLIMFLSFNFCLDKVKFNPFSKQTKKHNFASFFYGILPIFLHTSSSSNRKKNGRKIKP